MANITEIRTLLETSFGLPPETDPDAELFSSQLLSSLNSVQLLLQLEQSFGVTVSPLDVSIEDIDSIEKIEATIQRLKA